MDSVFRAVDGGEHLGGQTCRLFAQGRNAVADERVEVGLHAAGGIVGNPAAVFGGFDLRHTFDDLKADAVGRGDLEEPGLECEALGDLPGGRERLLDGGDEAFGTTVEVLSGFTPFGQGGFAQRAVACHEIERGVAELVAEFFETIR